MSDADLKSNAVQPPLSAGATATLTRTMTLIATGAPMGETLETIVRGVEAEHAGVLCSILILDGTGQHLLNGAAPSLPDAYNEAVHGLAIGPCAGSCGTAAYRRARVVVEDIRSSPLWEPFRELAAQAGVQSCWSEPIRGSGGRVLGTFAMYHRHPSTPSDDDVKSIVAAADLAAIAIERKQAEESLALSEARAQRALHEQWLLSETAGVGTWSYDPRSRALKWSAAWLMTLLGEAVGQATPEDFKRLCHPDDLERMDTVTRAAIEKGLAGDYTHRLKGRDGRWIWLRVHVHAESSGEGPHVVHGIAQNITELVEARDAAIHSEQQSERARRDAEAHTQRLKVALRAANAAVVEIDYGEASVWLSPHFAELVGRTMSYQEARQAIWPFVHPQDGTVVQGAVLAWLAGGPIEPIEVRIVRSDGSERWIQICTEIQRDDDGRWRRTISLLLDIDERKRQELALIAAEHAAHTAAEAKANFLANMSHEIRTPMNGVLGVLHLLRRQDPSPQTQSMLDDALACGAMLQQLLDDVVDFSKIEAGMLELENEPVDPRAVVDAVVKLLRPQAEDKGLILSVEARDLPDWIASDSVRLRQSLFNLIGNAIKFTERGSVTIRAARASAAAGPRLRFEVEDTGIGISREARRGLFERFRQADASTTRRFGGSGLGLAITRKLAEMMGGAVGLTSTLGRGSTFWLEVSAPPAGPPVAAELPSDQALDGLKILVVEDNPTNRMIVTRILEDLGACVQTAENGEDGVAAARRCGFDLILMDIQMPGIDGLEATRRIRALSSPVATAPIVALTANVLTHQREAFLAAGMNGMVAKPISPTALLNEIIRLVEISDAARAYG